VPPVPKLGAVRVASRSGCRQPGEPLQPHGPAGGVPWRTDRCRLAVSGARMGETPQAAA
jgi:hypothetical protein